MTKPGIRFTLKTTQTLGKIGLNRCPGTVNFFSLTKHDSDMIKMALSEYTKRYTATKSW